MEPRTQDLGTIRSRSSQRPGLGQTGEAGAITVWAGDRRTSALRWRKTKPRALQALVPEVPHTSEDHGDACFIRGADDVVVFLRAARLSDGGDAGGRGGFH